MEHSSVHYVPQSVRVFPPKLVQITHEEVKILSLGEDQIREYNLVVSKIV